VRWTFSPILDYHESVLLVWYNPSLIPCERSIMPVKIYGSSDDLIEVEGDIREEFYAATLNDQEDEGGILAFSNGVVLRILYTNDGIWRIAPVSIVGDSKLVQIDQAPEDDEDNYTDVATVYGDLKWVVFGR
jgi:hypothetical protein